MSPEPSQNPSSNSNTMSRNRGLTHDAPNPGRNPGLDPDPRRQSEPDRTNREPAADRTNREPAADRTEHAGWHAATVPDPASRPGQDHRSDGAAGSGHLDQRLVRAVQGFVDDPRRSVKEADAALEETVARMERAVQSHREALSDVRQGCKEGADTEALRVALTRYRALCDHLTP